MDLSQCKEDWKIGQTKSDGWEGACRLNAKRIESLAFCLIHHLPVHSVSMQRGLKEITSAVLRLSQHYSLNAKRIERWPSWEAKLPYRLVSMQRGLKEEVNVMAKEEFRPRSQCKEDWKSSSSTPCCSPRTPCLNAKRIERLVTPSRWIIQCLSLNAKRIESLQKLLYLRRCLFLCLNAKRIESACAKRKPPP